MVKSSQWIETNLKNMILGWRQKLYQVNLEHLVVPGSEDVLPIPTMMGLCQRNTEVN